MKINKIICCVYFRVSSENTVTTNPHVLCVDAVDNAEILFTTQK